MPNISTPDLVALLRKFQILEPSQEAELGKLLSRMTDASALAKELIGRGWLTPYQANLLLLGRGQELSLGAYVLLERLGEGGMGQVFKARNCRLGRIVALKMIRKDQLTSAAAVRRFQREVRAAAQLHHPNVIRAYDADEVRGQYLLAMEFIEEATDLARLVETNGRLPVAQACEYIRQAALGIQHAHEQGMVHRDIKPPNLLLTRDGKTVKVLDMGLARLDHMSENEESTSMTQEGTIMGTADYISPEQAINPHTADIRADIYSLGCTLYYLLTGSVPFPKGSFTEKLLQHQLDEPAAVEQHRPDMPANVGAIVRKMMHKKPEDRYQLPADVATDLAAAMKTLTYERIQVGAPKRTPARSGHADLVGTVSDQVIERVRPRRKVRKWQWSVYAVVGGAVALAGLVPLLVHFLWPAAKHAEPAVRPKAKLVAPAAEPSPPEVFQDFESGTYGDWKVTGTAFGRKPRSGTLPGQQFVSGYGGKHLVNTFLKGDITTGTLTSPEFTIKRSFINFRIGGGNKPTKTAIRLLVDGEVVRTATGNDDERLVLTSWEVTDLKGKKAVIEIIDHSTGPWGHINIDDIQFADSP